MKKRSERLRVCIDFDAVLAHYRGWIHAGHYGDPNPGAREFLEAMKAADIEVIVLTTRKATHGVRRWFRIHDLPAPVLVTNRKPMAKVYIDDRAVRFTGSFPKLLRDLKAFRVYWKPAKPFAHLRVPRRRSEK